MSTGSVVDAVEGDARERPQANPRIVSVDLLRGLVMVLMVLDHVRDFFGVIQLNPLNLSTTTVPLFFTRWVTHFCAPVFVLLAGTGAYLARTRFATRGALARFLCTRGLWLIVVEITLVRFGLTFDPTFSFIPLTVIWVIGVSMIILSALVFLPTPVIAALGVVMIAGHNAFDGVRVEGDGIGAQVWRLLHVQGPIGTVLERPVIGLYPLVPWIGVMAAGYGLGAILRLEPERRRRLLLMLGITLTGAFVVLRGINRYGDPQPWSEQDSPIFTALSFLNCNKYPPSLLYLLMTLGPALVVLAVFDRGLRRGGWLLETFGRVPLFFYLLQWYVIHLLAIAVAAARGEPFAWLIGRGPFGAPPEYGYGLVVVYAMWLVCLVLLYPPCAWFARLRQRRRSVWLSYL